MIAAAVGDGERSMARSLLGLVWPADPYDERVGLAFPAF
jgi:hypothetical protein